MKSHFLSLVLAFPLLNSCGSDDKDRGPDPLATVSGFCQEWAELACTDRVVDLCGADDTDGCQQSQSDFCEGLVPNQGYDSTHAKACLRAVEDAYKKDTLEAEELIVVQQLGGECARLIRGSAVEGEDCSEDTDCDTIEGYLCVKRPGEDGTCQIPVEVGAGRSCVSPESVCEEGFYCDGSHCVERLPEDAACTDSSECAVEFRCEGTSSGEGGAGNDDAGGSCVPRATGISSCETNDDCASGYCQALEDSTMGECYSLMQVSRREPICTYLR